MKMLRMKAALDAYDQIDLSIVIVSWNTRDILRDCLVTVMDGIGELRVQVIVVDNASDDGSAEMVETDFPEVELVRSPTNTGFAGGNNIGFRRCRGRQVLLLNSDTLVLGDVLERSVTWLDDHPDVGAMGCRVLNPDRTVQSTCFRYPSLLNLLLLTLGLSRFDGWLGRYQYVGWQRDAEREVEVLTGCFVIVRREVLEQVGELDDRFFFCGEETDWCLRVRRAGWRLVFAPTGEIVHLGNASGRRFEHRRDVLLSAGLVGLHAKHGGVIRRILADRMLLIFNMSRAVVWSLSSLLGRSHRARDRAAHFRGVVRSWGEVRERASLLGKAQ